MGFEAVEPAFPDDALIGEVVRRAKGLAAERGVSESGYRTVFNMYVVEGYSHKQIENILGISEGTSKSQLARAKSILQKKVAQYLSDTEKSYTREKNG